MTTPAVKDVPQLALGERVIEDGALMLAIEEARALKESHQGAQKVLKGLIEENGDYRGAFRVGRFKVTVTQRLSISITIPKPVKVKLPKAAKAKPLPETETVPMSVNGADGQPVRRQRRNGHGTPDELATLLTGLVKAICGVGDGEETIEVSLN